MKDYRKNLGREGEKKAAEYLENRGFTIIQTNFSVETGEADIIAEHDDIIYFIEVKTRRLGDVLESYSKKQKKRLWRLAEIYIAKNNVTKQVGFGLIAVSSNPQTKDYDVELIFDNFEP